MKDKFTFLLFLIILFTYTGVYGQGNIQVHFIDVGQGDSVLVTSSDSKAILIDAGIHSGADDPYNPFLYLKNKGIKTLDALFITHPHDDHYGGLKYLCSKQGSKEFAVKAVYYSVNPGPSYGKFNDCFEKIIKQSEVHEQVSARGPPIKVGGIGFQVLSPQKPVATPNKDKNVDSIVMKMTYANTAFMLTGDADQSVEEKIGTIGLQSEVLKVGHHGSRTATSVSFLEAVAPEYAVISANDQDGKGKTYAHPHQPTLDSLNEHEVDLYRTDLNGTIVMTSDGNKIDIETEKDVAQDTEMWEPGSKGGN